MNFSEARDSILFTEKEAFTFSLKKTEFSLEDDDGVILSLGTFYISVSQEEKRETTQANSYVVLNGDICAASHGCRTS